MIPIQVTPSQTLVRGADGEFVQSNNIAVNLGNTVNINDNVDDGATDSTWSSNRLRKEITEIAGQIAQQTLDLQQQIEEAKHWSVVVASENGSQCYSSSFKTNLVVRLYHGPDDVTDLFDDQCFIWKRESVDKDGDVAWNTVHNNGCKVLPITANDIARYSLSTEFICEFWYDSAKITSSKEE